MVIPPRTTIAPKLCTIPYDSAIVTFFLLFKKSHLFPAKESHKKHLDKEFVPNPSDTPTNETVSEHLDCTYW